MKRAFGCRGSHVCSSLVACVSLATERKRHRPLFLEEFYCEAVSGFGGASLGARGREAVNSARLRAIHDLLPFHSQYTLYSDTGSHLVKGAGSWLGSG